MPNMPRSCSGSRRRGLVKVRDDLGVAAAREHVALGRQSLADRLVVVQLAVLRRPDRAVLVGERLMPSFDVDDAQPSHADRDARGDVGADVVGAAVPDDVGHALEGVGEITSAGSPLQLHDPTDPAHPIHYTDAVARNHPARGSVVSPKAAPDLVGDHLDERAEQHPSVVCGDRCRERHAC